MSKPRRQGELMGAGKRLSPSDRMSSMPSRMSPIPIEWLDPDCWRLPSGKALAEFALQAGFLAPLMLGLPRPKRVAPPVVAKTEGEEPAGPANGPGEKRSGKRV